MDLVLQLLTRVGCPQTLIEVGEDPKSLGKRPHFGGGLSALKVCALVGLANSNDEFRMTEPETNRQVETRSVEERGDPGGRRLCEAPLAARFSGSGLLASFCHSKFVVLFWTTLLLI